MSVRFIKNCPFCGNYGELIRESLWDGVRGYRGEHIIYVRCGNKECGAIVPSAKFSTLFDDERTCEGYAMNRWNERADNKKE